MFFILKANFAFQEKFFPFNLKERYIFVFVLIELAIFICLNIINIQNSFSHYKNFTIINFFLYSIWLIINYFNNSYKLEIKSFKTFKVHLFICFRSLLIFHLLINILGHVKIFNFINDFLGSTENFIFYISALALRILFIYFYQKNINKLVLVGFSENDRRLINIIKNFNTEIKFIESKDINKLNIIKSKSNTEIIFAKKELTKNNSKLINSLLGKKYRIFKCEKWIEKYLYRSPFELTSFDKNKKSKLFKEFSLFIKTFFDKFLSLIILTISSPLILIASILIYLEDQGPIFYSQERTGLLGKKIKIMKLRTMKINAEENGPQWSKKNDKRITSIGKILRQTRVDEIPQLIQVLKGDLSLIGPRPERPEIDQILAKEMDNYYQRYSVKTGLSGWAQVNYKYGASIDDAKNKLDYDFYYIKYFSLWLDLKIFFKTMKIVLNAKGH